MKVLLLGSGGREHTLAWKIVQSPKLTRLFIAPGNAGTSMNGTNIPLSLLDFEAIKFFVLENDIEMVIVGPEEPLVKGLCDFFMKDTRLKDIPFIGPATKGAMLEGSKDFAKEFMVRHSIPTAKYKTFTANTIENGINFLQSLEPPYVLKADGLAAGKGVIICNSLTEAKKELISLLTQKKFGEASQKVVIEEFLKGIELSVFVITDGINYQILPEAKDYKRIGKNDSGPNTGGMGAVSPVPFATPEFMQKVENDIIKPTINGLKQEQIPYKGFIFFGLMNVNGNPFVIEYNCRMGDPETEVVLPRIKNDFLELLLAVNNGKLNEIKIEMDTRFATTVMLVSEGYPGSYSKGLPISNLDKTHDCLVFHSGTAYDKNDSVVKTAGGRVISITSLGNSMGEALSNAYKNAEIINFKGKYFRKDIGWDLMGNIINKNK